MSDKGWIKLHRKIIDNYLWTKKPFSEGQAWIDLLLLANHEDKKALQDGEIKIFKRGTVNRSIASLSERWGWDRRKTTRFLRVLESDEMLSVNSTTHGTTVTIINYSFYNDIRTTECTTECTTDAQPNVQPMHINKNEKNIKNEKKDNNYCPEFLEFWEIYPRKKEKAAANKQYLARLREGYSESELLEAAKRYAEECKKENREKKFTKLPKTFLGVNTPFVDYIPKKPQTDAYGREYKDGLLVWNIKYPKSEHPPYYGAPPEWFENGELVLDRVTAVYQPKEFSVGFYEPKVLTKEEVLEEITFRKEYFEKHGEIDG